MALLRDWADLLEQKFELLKTTENDLNGLQAHAEQLSSDIERTRPEAPVYKSIQDALKNSSSMTAKVLKKMLVDLEGCRSQLQPSDALGTSFEAVDRGIEVCADFADEYRERCMAFEAEGTEKKEKKAKKEKKEKDRQRSSSPRRSRERSSVTM